MKIPKMVCCIVLLLFTMQTHAFDPEDYHALVEERNSGDDFERQTRRLLLNGYHQGIKETIATIALINGNQITLGQLGSICLPSVDAINNDSIEKAIRSRIGTPSNKLNRELYGKINVASAAIAGLTEMFPCGE